MDYGWDGVGFLLSTVKQDKFDALCGCLQAKKYGKFLDMLDSVPVNIVKQTDKKGRNLLLILIRYLENFDNETTGSQQSILESKEFKRAMEVVTVLTNLVSK